MLKSFASGLHEEWSKPVDKCLACSCQMTQNLLLCGQSERYISAQRSCRKSGASPMFDERKIADAVRRDKPA